MSKDPSGIFLTPTPANIEPLEESAYRQAKGSREELVKNSVSIELLCPGASFFYPYCSFLCPFPEHTRTRTAKFLVTVVTSRSEDLSLKRIFGRTNHSSCTIAGSEAFVRSRIHHTEHWCERPPTRAWACRGTGPSRLPPRLRGGGAERVRR